MSDNQAVTPPTKSWTDRAPKRRTWFSLVLIVGFVALVLTSSLTSFNAATAKDLILPPEAEPGLSLFPQETGGDFSRFTHDRTHGSLPCLLCHRRESNSPKPQLPSHTPCAGCHAKKFADPSSPICTICHTDLSSATLKSFPNIRSFGIRFEHTQHVRGQGVSCATCHKQRRNGIALSIPSNFEAHSTCFQCHTNRASAEGKDISSCGTCHLPGRLARASESARAFQVSFSHSKHTSRGLNCVECHSVRSGAALGKQVSAPQPLMHHASAQAQSCMSCHNGKRTFGGDDFTSCKRCHLSDRFSWGRGRK